MLQYHLSGSGPPHAQKEGAMDLSDIRSAKRAEPPKIVIEAAADAFSGAELPRRRPDALSTDDGSAVLIGARLAPLA